jgi:predicted acylesterase/phospholipase RssA
MANILLPENPFGKIALSCSGGGYRAASFHLGTMSYLNHVKLGSNPLLEQVKLISTVSGGSITGVVYALMKQEGKSFDDIYHFLLERLINIDLLHAGFEKLNPTAAWPYTFKRKNLINVFAEQYDQAFTNGALMSVFNEMKSHLEAVVFNCTEFENAVNFRFRNGGWNYSGNYYNRIPGNQLREVKLSDVMASSSCFPGGFEPMCWPDDFVHAQSPNLEALAAKNAAADISPLGVMDGGIYDNQGIDSILRYKEKSEQPYFDLIILSDVASPDMKAYIPFKEKPKSGLRALTLRNLKDRINWLDRIGSMLLWTVLGLGMLIPLIFELGTNWLAGVCWTVAVFALLFLVARYLVKKKMKSVVFQLLFKIRDHIPAFYLKRLSNFDIAELSVHRAEPLIMDRINSLLTLLSSVFLKVVRRLNYNRLYEEETYRYRRISTLIKCLTRDNLAGANSGAKDKKGFFTGNYDADIGPAIEAVVDEAGAFGTTLWFTEQEKLDNVLKKLVATGQMTLCYNLILYLEQLKSVKDQQQYASLDPLVRQNIEVLYAQCMSDWIMFREDPMFLVKIKEARV